MCMQGRNVSVNAEDLKQHTPPPRWQLLEKTECQHLLLRSGGIDIETADESARAAASQVAKLVGYMPLDLGICGGIIADYEGGTDWQTELVELLCR